MGTAKVGFPKQIKYIVGNEACERFSFYGMRAILTMYMIQHLLMSAPEAKGTYHYFNSACYLLPLLGGFLSDRYWGKYKTIIYLSVVYCIGHAVLAVGEGTFWGLYAGLGLIALGTGGIKPCVSAHVGDQFDQTNKHLLEKVYEIFYFTINFGSFFSYLIIPVLLESHGPAVAFGLPGVLMFIATIVFWMGRKHYVHVPPSGKEGGSKFWPILFHSLSHIGQKKSGQSFLEVARGKFSDERVEGAIAAVEVFKVLVTVSVFWALFDQHGSTWVLQAEAMNRHVSIFGWAFELKASQVPFLNPIMVMTLIPLFSLVIYPGLAKRGIHMSPLRKMGGGMVIAGLSFVCTALLQVAIDGGQSVHVMWQVPQYLVMTIAEILVSITGLEFAYTQAPRAMKSTIMSLWMLTITFGNWIAGTISFINPFKGGAMEFGFYAALMFAVSGIFVWRAVRYKMRSYIEEAGAWGAPK